MVLKDEIAQKNDVAYQTIQHAFNNKKINHSYLVNALPNVGTMKFLLFLTQVIACRAGFACGKCSACVRISQQQYGDLHILDGFQKIIKKEALLQELSWLFQTSLEVNNVKILIIKNIENARAQTTNSLLKLLEEPPQNTHLLLSTNNINEVLPTIRSRSQILILNTTFRDQMIDELIKKEISLEDSCILSLVFSNTLEAIKFYHEDYLKYKTDIITFFTKWVDTPVKGEIFLMSLPWVKYNLKLFAHLFLIFCNDLWRYEIKKEINFKSFTELLQKVNQQKYPVYLIIEKTSQLLANLGLNLNIKLQVGDWISKVSKKEQNG